MPNLEVKKIACPCCGASLSINNNVNGEITCDFCRAIVFVDTIKNTGTIIYSVTDNKPLAVVNLPNNWKVVSAFADYNKSTIEIPYTIFVDLEDDKGSIVHIETGDSFQEIGGSFSVGQVAHTMQRPFITVDRYLDEFAMRISNAFKEQVSYKEDLDIPVENHNKQEDYEKYRLKVEEEVRKFQGTYGKPAVISALYCDSACRLYESDKKSFICYTKEFGNITSLAGIGNLNQGINNLMQGISGFFGNMGQQGNGNILNKMADSGLLGGMLGNKYKNQTNNQPTQVEQPVQPEKPEPTNEFLMGTFRRPGLGEASIWQSDCIFTLIADKEKSKKIYKKDFQQICSSFDLSPEVKSEFMQLKSSWEMENQSNLNNQAAAQRANGERLIQMGQQRMQANYNYIDSMRARSNQQFESQRSAYNSRMEAQDRMRDQRTEAILGVNTYIKPDGHEVQVPVGADTAWINGKGEIVGGSAGFDPGYGWTKMERK